MVRRGEECQLSVLPRRAVQSVQMRPAKVHQVRSYSGVTTDRWYQHAPCGTTSISCPQATRLSSARTASICPAGRSKGCPLAGRRSRRLSCTCWTTRCRHWTLTPGNLASVSTVGVQDSLLFACSNHVFEEVFSNQGILRGSTRILATHRTNVVAKADFTLVW